MDLTRPYTAISPTLDGTVLAVLAGTTRPLTGREVARLAQRRSHSGVLDVLNRLAEHGLVERQEAGRALLFTLNREHLAAPAVELLAGMRTELVRRVEVAIGRWETSPIHVSIFGSAARGDGDTHSDIDLFVVRPRNVGEDQELWQAQREELAGLVEGWTGNHAGIAEIGEDDLVRLRDERPPIVAELVEDAIVVQGPTVAQLLGEAR
ncbi:MAG TPA: nucleotidyltransferase domain-containing protein [Conexibacter sp.]|nr:nucleotidyltransferase domain-containing protein [Conexibacter sp.]